jgi:hypothetical protein
MARGPGMTIDEDKAAVQPTGIGTGQVRGFSTDLPNFDNSAQINAGAKIQNLGEELMQLAGQESARNAANSAVLERDPVTGAYKRPETPWMGLVTADTYNKIVDQRMTEQVVHDYETRRTRSRPRTSTTRRRPARFCRSCARAPSRRWAIRACRA